MEARLKPLVKGILSFGIPALRTTRQLGFETTGAEYCYSVFLRHFSQVAKVTGGEIPRHVAELGPGSSIAVGLAALIAGAEAYVGLDVADNTDDALNLAAFDRLVEMFRARRPVPQSGAFVPVFTPPADWEFPAALLPKLDRSLDPARLERIRADIVEKSGRFIRLVTPWTGVDLLPAGSLDWIFSQSVMEHVDDAPRVYACASRWLKPGGLMSHENDYTCHGVTRHWNGHWSIGPLGWTLLRGRRPYLINRLTHSDHLALLKANQFEILQEIRDLRDADQMPKSRFAPQFKNMSDSDARTAVAFVIARSIAR
jgi:SAM-dependent methyltransferase